MSLDHLLRGAVLAAITSAAPAFAAELTDVPNANPKLPGISVPTMVSPELRLSAVAEGAQPLENPAGGFGVYGFGADGAHVPAPGALPTATTLVEATKTEPD